MKGKVSMDHAQLGERYRDTLTRFEGFATCRTEYLYGCVRVGLEGVAAGKPELEYFDEQRLEGVAGEEVGTTARTGGDRPPPPSTGLR